MFLFILCMSQSSLKPLQFFKRFLLAPWLNKETVNIYSVQAITFGRIQTWVSHSLPQGVCSQKRETHKQIQHNRTLQGFLVLQSPEKWSIPSFSLLPIPQWTKENLRTTPVRREKSIATKRTAQGSTTSTSLKWPGSTSSHLMPKQWFLSFIFYSSSFVHDYLENYLQLLPCGISSS